MEGSCYICESDAPAPRSRCECTDRFVHDACLLQMVSRTGRASCGVCTSTFTNVQIRVKDRFKPTYEGVYVFVLNSVSLSLAVWITWYGITSWFADEETRSNFEAGKLQYCVTCMLMFIIQLGAISLQIWTVILYKRGVFRFFKLHQSCSVVVVNTEPEP